MEAFSFKTKAHKIGSITAIKYTRYLKAVLRIRIRMFLGLLNPDPDPVVCGTDPDPAPILL
jgi:hypothetical protein